MNGKIDSKAARKDDAIISDSDDSLPDITCDICDVEFSSVKSYETHLKGKKHYKMITKMKMMKKAKEVHSADKNASENLDYNDENPDESQEITCDVCAKSFTGYIPYATHLKGSAHKKNSKKEKIKNEQKDMPEVLHKEKDDSESDEDGILPKAYAKCSTCNKVFYGPEAFQQHMKSSIHVKKLQQQKVVENLKTKASLNGTNDDGDDSEAFSKCDTCKKSFSGPIPYHIHMKSLTHGKELMRAEIAKEVKEFYLEDSGGYVCKECKKPFTDPVAFKHHLTNNDHEKQKIRSEISSFLSDYPEMLMVTPDKSCSSGDDDEATPSCEHDSFWICKICRTSFSGPENARDHVKSKKHIAVKAELKKKKMLKDLREKQKSSAAPNESVDDDKQPGSIKNLPSSGEKKSDLKKLNGGLSDLHDEFEMI